jgi:hypothetical protein
LILVKYKKVSLLFLIFIAVYLAQVLFAPVDKVALNKYNINVHQLHELGLTIAIPYIIIWIIGLVGYLRLKAYSSIISASADGVAFGIIATGLFWFATWLPLTAILGNFSKQYYLNHPSVTAGLTIFNNYFALVFLGLAFIYTYYGSRRLLVLIKNPVSYLSQPIIIGYIIFSALYVLLVLHDPVRQVPNHDVARASYYLPDWLLTITIIIPRLLMWFLGIQAVRNILLYSYKVKGRLYRQALSSLAKGLAAVVITTIALRCLQSLPVFFSSLGLGILLIVVYILLIVIGWAYVKVANGAKKLQKLEEI